MTNNNNRPIWTFFVSLTLGAASALVLPGCEPPCDLAMVCEESNGRIVVGKVSSKCGAPPEGTGSTRSWTNEDGTCTCTLDSNANGQSSWSNCNFVRK